MRVTSHAIFAAAAQDAPVRVTQHAVFAIIPANRITQFEELISGPEIYTVTQESAFLNPDVHELNPHRPTIPEEFIDISQPENAQIFYDFSKEQAEILREQHNLTQAGDTTFPWEALTQVTTQRDFTLGSVGRFFHQDLGLIQARYVQFKGMLDTVHPCVPCGLLNVNTSLRWVVTNDLSRSDSDLVVGLKASFTNPADGEYGWLIVNGANVGSVEVESEGRSRGEPLTWSSTGKVSSTAEGRVVGRRIGTQGTATCPPGTMWVELESSSPASIQVIINESLGGINGDLAAFDLRLDKVETKVGLIAGLQSSVANLTIKLDTERQQRIAADSAILDMLTNGGFVTEAQLNSAKNVLNNRITNEVNALTILIGAAHARADEAYALAASIIIPDLSGLELSILSLMERVSQLETRGKVYLPLVTGESPPVLMYLDDGSLIAVEIP